ncbi:MAG: 5'-nucleotidase C-terminal domain-containing protein, partial [Oscillospiraceae bacterium]|nr:5'-nucleotidase C-terminal domain-containing protein [Oscillospiraceae bacterium]
MRKTQKLLAVVLVLAMVFSLAPAAFAAEGDAITVLYTNDVHTYIDGDLTYSKLAALKDSYEDVLLVDAGDHIQGTAYGSMDKGKTIVDLMNAAGYDAATLGNHEFDYGMEGRIKVTDEWAKYPYLSCNFYHEVDGEPHESVLPAYQVFEVGGKKIAFIGITTPETFTKSTPAYFQDAEGNYIYGIAGGEDGKALYTAVQTAIDSASQKADIVIALAHLGDDPASQPWTSEEVIANTKGLDAFIDGHSHSTIPGKAVKDAAGNEVWLTQTGEYLGAVGKLTISADGKISSELLDIEKISLEPDAEVKAIEDAWITEIDTKLGEVIGSIDDTLDNYDAEGKRLVRSQETNTGDFAADALYYLFENMGLDVDVAIMNGGGVRNKAITGDITYKTCKEIHTFGNVACLQTITGQQLLDALEWGARDVGTAECGGFLHVAGITYTVDTSIPSTVQKDDKGVWTGAPTGLYRVRDVMIKQDGEYVPLDLKAEYNLAGYNYTLRDLGDGFAMFDGAVNVLDYVMEDYMVLANFVKSFEGGKVTGYAEPQGRITILQPKEIAATVFYTNDIHTYIDGDLRYSELAGLRASMANSLLVDAGDHIQGTAFGSMDKGKTIIELMNAAGYDLATLGNHEFDYGMEGRIKVTDEWAAFPYVSANFYHEKDGVPGETVLDAYKVFEVGGKKIAFIGITTPESFTKSTPAYFQDGNGNYIYGIAGGEDGKALYAAVQKAIDAASAEADIVIALAHLGDDKASQPWTSEEVIANTKGLDAFIDGHSHSAIEGKAVKDAAGNDVLLTQTGEYLGKIGKMTIYADGTIATEHLTSNSYYVTPDADVKAIEDAWITEIDTKLGEVIGSIDDTFDNYDENGNRLVRKQETNTGDFCADALYYLFDNMGLDVDVAIMNGGGIRNKAITGDITYKTCKEIHTFGNVACLQTITGQQLLEALEWGALGTPDEEIGGFLHVAGIKYTVDTS